MDAPASGAGLRASLGRMFGTVLELGQTRLQLLATEFELEKLRIFDALLWAVAGLLFAGVGLVLLAALVLLMLQEAHRLPALAVMVLVSLGLGLGLLREARRRLQAKAALFEASAAELERDRAALK